MKALGIIPARYASSRFPGKPLVKINGLSMIQRVYQQAQKAALIGKVVVATDDQRIYEHILAFGGEVMMTDPMHQSGTDRCAEVASRMKDWDLVINIQGDEPFINPQQIDQVVQPFLSDNTISISTLAKQIEKKEELFDSNTVKVVLNHNSKALYFSRQSIPFFRNIPPEDWLKQQKHFKHIGIYGFRRKVLLELSQLKPSNLEKAEALEQLRWLENGYSIFVGLTSFETFGIDVPEDLEKIESGNYEFL